MCISRRSQRDGTLSYKGSTIIILYLFISDAAAAAAVCRLYPPFSQYIYLSFTASKNIYTSRASLCVCVYICVCNEVYTYMAILAE